MFELKRLAWPTEVDFCGEEANTGWAPGLATTQRYMRLVSGGLDAALRLLGTATEFAGEPAAAVVEK